MSATMDREPSISAPDAMTGGGVQRPDTATVRTFLSEAELTAWRAHAQADLAALEGDLMQREAFGDAIREW